MKFKFCGGSDVPDWLLSEIATLSNISSVRVKLLSNIIVSKLLGFNVNYPKVTRLTEDTEFTPSDVKAILSALNFILHNAVRNAVSDDTLSDELQQLGLPKESANAIKRAYKRNQDELTQSLQHEILSLPTLSRVDWSVDYILSSSILRNVNEPLIRVQMSTLDHNATSSKKMKHSTTNGEESKTEELSTDDHSSMLSRLAHSNQSHINTIDINMTADTLNSFLSELKTVQRLMDEL